MKWTSEEISKLRELAFAEKTNPENATIKQAKIISQITGIPVDKIFFCS
jgi:hypothetical protein